MPLSSVIAHGRQFGPVFCLAAPMLAGCAAPPPPAELTAGPKTATVFLIERGWHTDIGVPAAQIGGKNSTNSARRSPACKRC